MILVSKILSGELDSEGERLAQASQIEQKQIHDTIVSGPRGHVVGPLRIWLNNPGLARSAQTVGEYSRYGTSLSK